MAKKKLNITDQIRSYLDACKYNGKQPLSESKLLEAGVTPKQIAGIELEEITLALNEGKPTDIYNGEPRYYPVFWTYEGPSGFAFQDSRCAFTHAAAGSGSRHSYHDKAVSDYSGRQFTELWKEYLS
ncbi:MULTISPECIES: hypothetical protein [unclassified Dysgonomonas]|uniref:hypothetical protein n=1 Tax=unclassified Dysgonomonas TaxID=2630389 RepID=UPI0025BFE8E2|nr:MULTISPECIES: hypothetical protein [unclassified Dysgonomonas]HMM02007.1 hypothetical protein [Dysgonomonas sp.]